MKRSEADKLLPSLGVPLDCGGAVVRRKGGFVDVEAEVEIRTIGHIVGQGVPVLVTERLPVEPIPAKFLTDDPVAWFKHLEKGQR